MRHDIDCQNCRRVYRTHSSQTKLCGDCGLLRNVRYFADKPPSSCAKCAALFAKTKREEAVCPKCHGKAPALGGTGDCAFCGTRDTDLIRPYIKVCLDCAHDPARRPAFLEALERKMAAIAEQSRVGDAPSRAPSWWDPSHRDTRSAQRREGGRASARARAWRRELTDEERAEHERLKAKRLARSGAVA